MKCIECGQIIPDESTFCPYCGHKFEAQKADISTKKKAKWPIVTLVLCILLTVAIAIGIIGFYIPLVSENSRLNSKIKSVEQEVGTLQNELSQREKKINSLNESVKKAKNDLNDYKRKHEDSSEYYEDMMAILSNASTTNGIISVSNKIYCVKKGETLTIKINWPSNETTQYMGLDDYGVASATWNNSNVAIKGINQGITELSFSSNQAGTKDQFSVVIVCY